MNQSPSTYPEVDSYFAQYPITRKKYATFDFSRVDGSPYTYSPHYPSNLMKEWMNDVFPREYPAHVPRLVRISYYFTPCGELITDDTSFANLFYFEHRLDPSESFFMIEYAHPLHTKIVDGSMLYVQRIQDVLSRMGHVYHTQGGAGCLPMCEVCSKACPLSDRNTTEFHCSTCLYICDVCAAYACRGLRRRAPCTECMQCDACRVALSPLPYCVAEGEECVSYEYASMAQQICNDTGRTPDQCHWYKISDFLSHLPLRILYSHPMSDDVHDCLLRLHNGIEEEDYDSFVYQLFMRDSDRHTCIRLMEKQTTFPPHLHSIFYKYDTMTPIRHALKHEYTGPLCKPLLDYLTPYEHWRDLLTFIKGRIVTGYMISHSDMSDHYDD
jgi:hypothetical protein